MGSDKVRVAKTFTLWNQRGVRRYDRGHMKKSAIRLSGGRSAGRAQHRPGKTISARSRLTVEEAVGFHAFEASDCLPEHVFSRSVGGDRCIGG